MARNLNYFLRRNLRGPTYILTPKTPPHDPPGERGGLNLFSVKGIPRGRPSSRSNYTRHNIAILSSSILFKNGLISLIFSLILTIFRRKTSSCWYFYFENLLHGAGFQCDTSSHTFDRKEWKEEKLVRGPRGPVWRPSGDLFLDTCGLVGLREVYRGADAPIPVRVRLLPVDDDAEPLGDVHDYHQALL